MGADFHLFKEGVEPKWEDPSCEHGGKWTVLVPKGPQLQAGPGHILAQRGASPSHLKADDGGIPLKR